MNFAQIARVMRDQFGLRMDAAQSAILARALEYVQTQTYDVKYPAYKARDFIPTDDSVPTGAETFSYKQWDGFGMAKVITNYADDLPMVDVLAREFVHKIKSLGDSYQYTVQDLRAISMSGQPIDTYRANQARRAIEAAIDEIAAVGLPEVGFAGFLNHPNIPLVAPDTGNWSTATPTQIIADMNKLVNSIPSITKQVHAPDTLLLDTDSFALVASTPVGDNLEQTILSVFLSTNPYIKNVDQWYRLDTADVAGTGPRIMAYERREENMGLVIPQEFEQFPPQPRNLAYVVPCHARIGGVVFRYPLAAAYMDIG